VSPGFTCRLPLCMTNDIRVDIEAYERKRGKPVGCAFWTFRIVSPTVTIKDKIITTAKVVTYQAACEEARRIAALRGSELIVLVPVE